MNEIDTQLKEFRDTKRNDTWETFIDRKYVTNLVRKTKKQYNADTIEEIKDKPKLMW